MTVVLVILTFLVFWFIGTAIWAWLIMLLMGVIANLTGNPDLAWGFWQVFPIAAILGLLTASVRVRV
jgi:hypothetical protein